MPNNLTNIHDLTGEKVPVIDVTVAQRLVESNELIANKLLESDRITAENLDKHNQIMRQEASKRFSNQKAWNWIHGIVGITTLVIIMLFAIAFFNYAIIVHTH